MALPKHDGSKQIVPRRPFDFFDRFFDDLPEGLRRPVLFWPDRGAETMRVDEFTEDGTLVVRLEVAGIDPEKDVEISVHGDILHIAAERHEEEKTEERDYVRRELRYGSFHRDMPLPKGITEKDVKASYKDGILEIRVPIPSTETPEPKKIAVAKG